MKSPAADFAAEAKPLFQSSGSCLICHVESFHEIIPTFGIRTSLEKSQIMDIHFNLSNNTSFDDAPRYGPSNHSHHNLGLPQSAFNSPGSFTQRPFLRDFHGGCDPFEGGQNFHCCCCFAATQVEVIHYMERLPWLLGWFLMGHGSYKLTKNIDPLL